jgi:hypothetical protein
MKPGFQGFGHRFIRPGIEDPYNSSGNSQKPRFFPFFADISVDSMRRTPSPSPACVYKTVNSIIQDSSDKSRMNLSIRKRDCIGNPSTRLKFASNLPRIATRSPIKPLKLSYTKLGRSNKSSSPYGRQSKTHFEIGCQIDIA